MKTKLGFSKIKLGDVFLDLSNAKQRPIRKPSQPPRNSVVME